MMHLGRPAGRMRIWVRLSLLFDATRVADVPVTHQKRLLGLTNGPA